MKTKLLKKLRKTSCKEIFVQGNKFQMVVHAKVSWLHDLLLFPVILRVYPDKSNESKLDMYEFINQCRRDFILSEVNRLRLKQK